MGGNASKVGMSDSGDDGGFDTYFLHPLGNGQDTIFLMKNDVIDPKNVICDK